MIRKVFLLALVPLLIVHSKSLPVPHSYSTYKRGLDLDDISYSYAATEMGRNNAHVKTMTMIKTIKKQPLTPVLMEKVFRPSYINADAGFEEEYWPADMKKEMRMQIKAPIMSPSFTYSFVDHHEVPRSKTAPVTFPEPSSTTKKPEVVAGFSKLQSITKPEIPALSKFVWKPEEVKVEPPKEADYKFKDFEGFEFGSDFSEKNKYKEFKFEELPPKAQDFKGLKEAEKEEPTKFYLFPSKDSSVPSFVDSDDNYPKAYLWSPEKNDLAELAHAVSAGDIKKIKELANNLKDPEEDEKQKKDEQITYSIYEVQEGDKNRNGASDAFEFKIEDAIKADESNKQENKTQYAVPRIRGVKRKVQKRNKIPINRNRS